MSGKQVGDYEVG